jgi:hypothetical protein
MASVNPLYAPKPGRRTKAKEIAMNRRPASGGDLAMTTSTVTETLWTLEPVSRDPFIDGLHDASPTNSRPAPPLALGAAEATRERLGGVSTTAVTAEGDGVDVRSAVRPQG